MPDDPNAPTTLTIETALAPLRVQVIGSGPPALLWHSLFVDSTTWCRLRDRLSGHRRLILIDGPSHGHSGAVVKRFTLDDCAAAASEVLAGLSVDSPVDWVGNAWGGHVGIAFAAANPSRCRSLIAIGAPVRALTAGERRKIGLLLAVYRIAGPVPLVNALGRALLGGEAEPRASAIVGDAFRIAQRQGMANAIKSVSLARPDLAPTLARITAPTLFVAGATDAMWTPIEAAQSARRLQHGAVVAVLGAGHLAPLFQGAPELGALIADFWGDPDRFVQWSDRHRAMMTAQQASPPPAAAT